MPRGDFKVFDEFTINLGQEKHTLASDVLKLGLITNVVTPTEGDATPTWSDYSANQVGTGGGYPTGGITLSGVTFTEVGGVATLDDTGNISLAQNAAGFTNAYWGILYNATEAGGSAIGFLDLGGPVSEVAGPIAINWGASGILTITA